METFRISEMTVDELKALIAQVVDERLYQTKLSTVNQPHLREILASIDRHQWTPPPKSPTGSEMIIAERDRWRNGM